MSAYSANVLPDYPHHASETLQVSWLMDAFSICFQDKNTRLVKSEGEPEYFPKTDNTPAKICFAHGFFSSALHELSHWTIAGKHRRTIPDFGYWYTPDGRNAEQQAMFEKVEVKPQAIEWLFTLACNRKFRVSLDNLNGNAGNSEQFKKNVYEQARAYLKNTDNLPPDAKRWFEFLQQRIRPEQAVHLNELLLSEI